MVLLWTLGGMLLGFGLLSFLPFMKGIRKVLAVILTLVLVGFAFANVGFPMLADFLANYPSVSALAIGTFAGAVISDLIGM